MADSSNPAKPRSDVRMVRMSHDVLQQLAPIAAEKGIDLPGVVQYQSKLDLDAPDSDVARNLGMMCSRQAIFLKGDTLVALDNGGRMRSMTARRLGGWIEKFTTTVKFTKEKGEHPATMLEAQAGRIMENDEFLVRLRRLDFFFPVRLPVPVEGGGVRLLEPGYDDATCSWTEDGLSYDEDWDMDRAWEWILLILGDMPYADLVHAEVRDLSKSRNAAVALAGLLGTYLRAFFPAGTVQPMILATGTQPGTGKTQLCKAMFAPVYGLYRTLSLPQSEEKLIRLLDNTALGFAPVLLLDDVGRQLASHRLNAFVTSPLHSGETMYKNENYEVPNVTQIFATGNDLNIDDNIARRAMQCELLLQGDVQGREFGFKLTDKALGSKYFRSRTLAALWAMVRHWAEQKAAREESGEGLEPRKVLASFDDWTALVGSIVGVLGWRDPLDTPENITGGDTETRDFKALLLALADAQTVEMEEYPTARLIERAQELGLLGDLVGEKGDELRKNDKIKFGRRLQKYRGQVFERTNGTFFEFGKRDGKGGSIYPCRLGRTREELG